MIEGHWNNAITHLYHNSGYQFAIDPALNEQSARQNSAGADTDSTTTDPQAVDRGVTRGMGETVEGGVDGLDQLRLDARGKYEKWCLNCKSWVSLGSSKGSECAFRVTYSTFLSPHTAI